MNFINVWLFLSLYIITEEIKALCSKLFYLQGRAAEEGGSAINRFTITEHTASLPEGMTQEEFQRTMAPCRQALLRILLAGVNSQAKAGAGKIDNLTGRSDRGELLRDAQVGAYNCHAKLKEIGKLAKVK